MEVETTDGGGGKGGVGGVSSLRRRHLVDVARNQTRRCDDARQRRICVDAMVMPGLHRTTTGGERGKGGKLRGSNGTLASHFGKGGERDEKTTVGDSCRFDDNENHDNDGNYMQQPAKNTQASQRGDHIGYGRPDGGVRGARSHQFWGDRYGRRLKNELK